MTTAHAPELPETDPRLERRRHEVDQAQRHRRLAHVGEACIVVAIGATGILALHSPLFAARHIVVGGVDGASQSAVIAAAGLATHPPLIDVNTALVARRIEALPDVLSATVSRRWPESITIEVTDRVPVAFAALRSGEFAVLDASGRVLSYVAHPALGLIEVKDLGPLPEPGGLVAAQMAAVTETAAAIPASLVGDVSAVSRSRSEGVLVALRAGPVAIVGQADDLGAKFVALATLLQSATVQTSTVRVIDLRVPGDPVLTP